MPDLFDVLIPDRLEPATRTVPEPALDIFDELIPDDPIPLPPGISFGTGISQQFIEAEQRRQRGPKPLAMARAFRRGVAESALGQAFTTPAFQERLRFDEPRPEGFLERGAEIAGGMMEFLVPPVGATKVGGVVKSAFLTLYPAIFGEAAKVANDRLEETGDPASALGTGVIRAVSMLALFKIAGEVAGKPLREGIGKLLRNGDIRGAAEILKAAAIGLPAGVGIAELELVLDQVQRALFGQQTFEATFEEIRHRAPNTALEGLFSAGIIMGGGAIHAALRARADFRIRLRDAKTPAEQQEVLDSAREFIRGHREARDFVQNATPETLRTIRERFEGRTDHQSVAMRELIDKRLKGEPGAEAPPPPRRYPPSELTSREGLMQFARDNPDLALKLSKRTIPSRKDLSRLTPAGMSMSKEQRREMGDLLRSEVLPALRKEARSGQEEREVRAVRPAREGEQPPQERVGAEAREPIRGVPRIPEAPAEARAEVAPLVPRETPAEPTVTRAQEARSRQLQAAEKAADRRKQDRPAEKPGPLVSKASLDRYLQREAEAAPSPLDEALILMGNFQEEGAPGGQFLPTGDQLLIHPDELADLTPIQKARLLKTFAVSEDATAQEDLLGAGLYRRAIEDALGGKAGRARNLVDEALAAPEHHPPQTVFTALMRRGWDERDADKPQKLRRIEAHTSLPNGTTFTIYGQDYSIVTVGGKKMLRAPNDIALPLELLDYLAADEGSLTKGLQAGQPGLLAEGAAGPITGKQAALPLPEPSALGKEVEAQEAAKRKAIKEGPPGQGVFEAMGAAGQPDFKTVVDTPNQGAADPPINRPPTTPPPDRVELYDGGFDLPSESAWDVIVRKVQDKMRPLKRAQQEIIQQGGTLDDLSNAYLAETLFAGKVEDGVKETNLRIVDPMIRLMTRLKLTPEDVGQYLYARFAPDRNAVIAKINRDFVARGIPGSGMSNTEAATILKDFDNRGMTTKLKRIARFVDRLNRKTREILLKGGNVSQAQIDDWIKRQGPFYVPLRTDMVGQGARLGRGFDIRGKESQEALGRRSKADNPLYFSLMQHQAAIVRAEKNQVGQRLHKFVSDNPAPDLWEVDPKQTKPALDQLTGLVVVRYDPLKRLAPNVFSVKFEGEQTLIEFKGNAAPIARAMKNMGADQAGSVVRWLTPAMRFLSAINTSYNPEFIITNLVRDLQTAGINITAGHSAGMAARVLKNVPAAIRGALGAIRNKKATGVWAQRFHDFTKTGGKVGWFHMATLQERAGELAAKLKNANPTKPRRVLMGLREIAVLVQDTNAAVENGIRLSAFVEFQKLPGVSKEQAAAIAKNLTVNFNRKGEWGQAINSLYLFSNASIQGTARMFTALKSARGRSIAAGIIAGSFFLVLINRWLAGEDDDGENYYDKIPPWEKERNLIIMAPGAEGRHLTIPLPYGYSVFHAFGQQIADTIETDQTSTEALANLWAAMLGSFNPLGSQTNIVQQMAPTLVDPIVQLAMNEKFYGAPITPEQSPYGPPKPRSELYWASTGKVSVEVAQTVNRFTGGDEVVAGFVDIHPGWFDHLFEFVTGGTGRTVSRSVRTVTSVLKGDRLPLRTIPFVRRFVAEVSEFKVSQDFYKNRGELDLLIFQVKHYRATDQDDKADRLVAANKGLFQAAETLKRLHKSVTGINRMLNAKGLPDERRDELEQAKDKWQREANHVFSKAQKGSQ